MSSNATTTAPRTCANPECDEVLPVQTWRGRPQKWCSDSCRKYATYVEPCVDCGADVHTNGMKRKVVRCMVCAHDHARGREISTENQWTDEQIIGAMKVIAQELGEPVTVNKARAFLPTRPDLPSVATITHRFGWEMACRAAGVRCGAKRRAYTRISYADAVDVVVSVARETGSVPFFGEYVRYRMVNEDVPSDAIIRLRIKETYGDGSWAHIMRDAERALTAA